jgi:hypothetical protein
MNLGRLWLQEGDETPYCLEPGRPLRLRGRGARGDAEILIALTAAVTQGALAVALVPDELERVAFLNGIALGSSMHVLRHADLLELSEKRVWVSTGATPTAIPYDVELHGRDVFCMRTKARLKPGEAIVVCPGTSRESCGMIYKAAAWETGLPCHHCRFDPKAPAWSPPVPKTKEARPLERLLRLARASGGAHAA